MAAVTTFYKDDFKPEDLQSQLTTMAVGFCSTNQEKDNSDTIVHQVVQYVRSLSACQRDLLPEIIQLVKLILVMPATNVTSERTFSALRWIKTYLRSTMTQTRLNHIMLLHVHNHKVDQLDPNNTG